MGPDITDPVTANNAGAARARRAVISALDARDQGPDRLDGAVSLT